MQTLRYFVTSEATCLTTQCQVTEELYRQQYRSDNLKNSSSVASYELVNVELDHHVSDTAACICLLFRILYGILKALANILIVCRQTSILFDF